MAYSTITRHLIALSTMALTLNAGISAQEIPSQEISNVEREAFQFPTKGVRFVICSPTNEALPAPLYAKVNGTYVPIQITSRMPSPRLSPDNGVIKLYDSIPDAKKEADTVPYLSIDIPRGQRTKSICVVQPNKDGGKPKTYFFKENDFAKGGVYVVNLSSSALEMTTDETGKFSGDEKKTTINPYSGEGKEISAEEPYVWAYGPKKQKTRLPFALYSKPTAGKMTARRIVASSIYTLPSVAQVSFVVNHPTLKGSYRLLSIQYIDEVEANKTIIEGIKAQERDGAGLPPESPEDVNPQPRRLRQSTTPNTKPNSRRTNGSKP